MAEWGNNGLTPALYAKINSGRVRRALRMKVLKAIGKQQPDWDTTSTLNLYMDGASSTPPLDDDDLLKIIHDDKTNRTFILYGRTASRKTTASTIIAGIINHDLETTDADFIEEIDSTTAPVANPWAAWLGTDPRTIYDMAYDPNNQLLAFACSGGNSAPKTPGLLVVDVNKYTDTLEVNECNVLQANPDYLSADFWTCADDTITNATSSAYHEYVGFYETKFWVINYTSVVAGVWRQLAYYTDSSTYTVSRHFGYPPTQLENNALGNKYDSSMWWPFTAPRSDQGFVNKGGILYTGDPWSLGLQTSLSSFHIDGETGLMTLGFTPIGSGVNPPRFGIEGHVLVLDLNNYAQNMVTLDTANLSWTSVEGPPGTHVISDTIKTTTLDCSDADGWTQFYYYELTTSNNGYSVASDYCYVQTDYGTPVMLPDNPAATQYIGYARNTYYVHGNAAITVGMRVAGGTHTQTWGVGVSVTAYRDPMIVAILNQDVCGSDWYISGDTTVPTTGTWTDGYANDWELAEYYAAAPEYSQIKIAQTTERLDGSGAHLGYDTLISPQNAASAYIGLWWGWCRDDFNSCGTTQFTEAGSDLYKDAVRGIYMAGQGALIFSCNVAGGTTASAVQFLDISGAGAFGASSYTPLMTRKADIYYGVSLFYDVKRRMAGVAFGEGLASEVQFWWPDVGEGEWNRDPRVWWDGTDPDIIIGEYDRAMDDLGQPPGIFDLNLTQSKGQASSDIAFTMKGSDCLPDAATPFNENADFPGTYDATLQHGSRVILQSGIYDGRSAWTWLDEGQAFIQDCPESLQAGQVAQNFRAGGVISMLVTRATYKGFHEPDITSYPEVTMTIEADNMTFHYETGGNTITDWRTAPPPKITCDDGINRGYTLDANAGTVTFQEDMSARTVTATFDAYDAGTNEAEEIILCILTWPNELGGCGLNLSYVTRIDTDMTCEDLGSDTYQLPYDMVIWDDSNTVIYDNGVAQTEGVNFTWSDKVVVKADGSHNVCRQGQITFTAPPTGPVTADAKYFTIQRSGITLAPIHLNPRKQTTAFDCLNEIMRQVSPNYLMWEARDGKIWCDHVTQKAAADADVTILDTDIVFRSIENNPAYEDLATRVLSYGQADMAELENYALGKTVTDLNTILVDIDSGDTWKTPADIADITDGDPATGPHGGRGGDWGATVTALIATAPDGHPLLSIDLGQEREVNTIIVGRISGPATELPNGIENLSIWASLDGTDWLQIVNQFELPCGQNVKFTADGGQWMEGYQFRYIRINIHTISIYANSKGGNDSLWSLSEVQCLPNEIIEGVAVLQNTDPTAPLYDTWGLLDKYGYITHVARGGSPDNLLRSQTACDLDARYTLEELMRLMTRLTLDCFYLPAVPIYSTISVANTTLGISTTFFIEGRTLSIDSTSFQGVDLQ